MVKLQRIAGNRAFTKVPSWRKAINSLEHATSLLQTGMFAKPDYYDALRRHPPFSSVRATKAAQEKDAKFPEESLIQTLLRRRPILKLEWSEMTDIHHVPIRQKFVEKQLQLMKEQKMKKNDAYWKVDEMFNEEIDEFEKELIAQKGDIILNARRDMLKFVKEREQFFSDAREVYHQKRFLRTRLMNVSETVEANLNYMLGQKPAAVYGNGPRRMQADEFSMDDLPKKDRDIMQEYERLRPAGVDSNPVWGDC